MATIYIDKKPYEVNPDKNLLEACLTLGFDLPYFCWHPAMGSVGACRQCAVKVFKDADDAKGRLIMSCMEPVKDKLYLSVQDPEAKEFRAHVIEWLMTNHPHDCAVCDEGGSCHLQDMTVMTGHTYRQYKFKKRTYQNQYLGPFLNHEMNRCIQCYRCVRFYKDYAGGKDLDVFAAHNHVYFGRHEDGVLESEFSGNLAEVCPTGVFTDKTLKQHYTRKWDLTMAPSICHHCSLGCNIIAGERYGSLRQITSRYHGEVNGYFICDRGRFGYEFVNDPGRIRKPLIRGQHPEAVSKEKVLAATAEIVKQGKVIGIGSPRASIESNFALQTLVGEDNFYKGVSDDDYDLMELVLKILRESPAAILSMKEVEKADAVFILGEDLTNTAPMLALSIRQSVRQQPLEQVTQAHLPLWQDAAARELVQDQKGPLFIASFHTTKLDEIATSTYQKSPDSIARLGFAVANLLSNASPDVTHLSGEEQALAQQIADALLLAKRPLVVSGSSCASESILHAAANIAAALCERGKPAGIALVVPECNSLGLALMGGHKLDSAIRAVSNRYADTVIILENDLYRRAKPETIDKFLQRCKQVIVLDHTQHATTEKANILIPVGTFAESDGTLVNNEGRAQRFYQVYPAKDDVLESWHWLPEIGTLAGNAAISPLKTLDDILRAIWKENPSLRGIETLAPPAGFRIAGQKIPREPHRYSGRTAMNAQERVSEPKPPEDPDSPLSFTMEGYRGQAPSSLIPFFWSPGWNSVQSINKYQTEVGGSLRNGDPGICLITNANKGKVTYFKDVPEPFKPLPNHLLMVPVHHIFGSEELSVLSPGIAERIPEPYVAINAEDAIELRVAEGQVLDFNVNGQAYRLPVKVSGIIAKGTAGLPNGLPGVYYAELPAWAILKQAETTLEETSAHYFLIVGGVLFVVLNVAAGLIWVERRMLALWQDRYGPNRAGPFGLFIVVADTLKLFFKEDWIPPFASKAVFVIAPAIVVATVMLSFVIIPFAPGVMVVDFNIGILFFLAMSSMGAYSIILGGWASNNKYALLGAMRGAAQMITYEVFMGLSLMGVVLLSGSFSLKDIVEAQRGMWYIVPQFLGFVIFLIAGVAETHRLPFDIPEAESELIAGFHSEYSGMKFGMFFIGEYMGITLISSLVVALYFGGWLGPGFLPPLVWFAIKTFAFICLFILLRASLPRPRYDQLMEYGWKILLPLTLVNLMVTAGIILANQ